MRNDGILHASCTTASVRSLAALGMNIAIVQRESGNLSNEASRAVSESAFMVEELSREIRTMSHLLHPPMLDEIGLPSALRWYVDGFSERSKVKVNLDIPEGLGRLSSEMELTIFRMIQECLTNVHRHSGSTLAAIRVRAERSSASGLKFRTEEKVFQRRNRRPSIRQIERVSDFVVCVSVSEN